ncbi:MAG: PaaI family thioesterase [Myxococcota bacterium]
MTTTLLERLQTARETGDFAPVLEAVPYAQFLGIEVDTTGGLLTGKLCYTEHLIGNATIPALHGGTIGALLESTAIFKLLWESDTFQVPKTINITVEYLRSGKAMDTYARGEITRQGRRVANVRVMAWQEDPEKPIASANAHFLLTPPDERT